MYIQKCYRGYIARWRVANTLFALSGKPSLQRAREYKRSMQPHTVEADEEQKHKIVPLPLSCPIECFQVFGEGIYVYMLWMRMMKRTFAVAFALALSNMAHNWAGKDQLAFCGGNCWLSVHTIGNVESLNASYGVSELLVLLVFLYAMFASLSIVRAEEGRQRSERTNLTLADHTVLLQGLPAVPPTKAALAEAMAEHGAVHSVHIAYAIRDVLLRMKERKLLMQDMHAARSARRPPLATPTPPATHVPCTFQTPCNSICIPPLHMRPIPPHASCACAFRVPLRCELCVLRVALPQPKLLKGHLKATTRAYQRKVVK